MNTDFYQTVLSLKTSGSSFVTATVVSRRAPVSSHLGDRALIFWDGRMQGFVGGSCSREIVRKQALEALKLGKPRLVLIRPDATLETIQHASDAEGIVVPMTCASEGAVDVYLEPHGPAPLLLVAGFTPVAEAVARMAALLEYNIVRIVTRAELRDFEPNSAIALPELPVFLENLSSEARANLAAVVATQGHYDEPVLEALLLAKIGFVSLLASRKRAVTVRELLELQGVPLELVNQIRNPAGLDINAKTPAEVAVSILAEIIKTRDSSQAMFTNSSQYQKPVFGNEDSLDVTGRIQDSPLRDAGNDMATRDGKFFLATNSINNQNQKPRRGELYVRPVTKSGNEDTLSLTGRIQATIARQVLVSGQEATQARQVLVSGQEDSPLRIAEFGFAISPVDGERIEIASAVHFTDFAGVRYYFTCANCKRRFLKDPQKFLSVLA